MRISCVEPANLTEDFEVSYSESEDLIVVALKSQDLAVKTHSLKLKVSFVGQATNQKPVNVTLKVVVKE